VAINPPTIADLLTDAIFESADLTKLRDDIETNHDHTAGNGVRLGTDSVADSLLTDAKFVSNAAIRDEIGVTVVKATEPFTDLQITADSTVYKDTALALTINFGFSTVVEAYYLYRLVEPTLDVAWQVSLDVNGTFNTGHIVNHRSNVIYGQTIRLGLAPSSGSLTLIPAWKSVTAPGGNPIQVRATRIFALVVWSQ